MVRNDLLPFLGRVGTGQRGSKDLSYDEAYQAMAAILEGRFEKVTLGAFLLAMRWKEETAEELAGFADAIHELSVIPLEGAPPGLLDCAGNYDGKIRTVNVGVAAALVAAAAGQPILLHGAEAIPTKSGVTAHHVLAALGVAVGSPEGARRDLAGLGIAYLHQPAFNPGIHALLAFRHQVGKRTFLNSVEHLANPARAAAHLGSCFHIPFAERLCHAQRLARHGARRVVIVEGVEGSDELRPGRALMAELRDGEVAARHVESATLGLASRIGDLPVPAEGQDLAAASAAHTDACLGGGGDAAFRETVLLNAAVRLYAGGRAADLQEGVALADRALATGEAARLLEDWRRPQGGGTQRT